MCTLCMPGASTLTLPQQQARTAIAPGHCSHHGADCNFLHRVPTARDEERHKTDYSHDIFGRERQPEGRDSRKKGEGMKGSARLWSCAHASAPYALQTRRPVSAAKGTGCCPRAPAAALGC